MRHFTLALLLTLISCSGPAPEAAKSGAPVVPASHEPPNDLSTKFPVTGQVKMQLLRDHLFGKDFMPGGNLADYKTEDGEYQLFLVEAPEPQKAAFMLLDWKNAIPEAKYNANFGGYTGTDQGKPFFIFAKGMYLAGVIGLPEAKADPLARLFAAKL